MCREEFLKVWGAVGVGEWNLGNVGMEPREGGPPQTLAG